MAAWQNGSLAARKTDHYGALPSAVTVIYAVSNKVGLGPGCVPITLIREKESEPVLWAFYMKYVSQCFLAKILSTGT